MQAFAAVLREYRTWLTSFRIVNMLMPFHLYILFGGIGAQFLYQILARFWVFYSIINTIGHYAFFAGVFLTLASHTNKKYLPYALWAHVFVVLFPFRSFSLYQVIESVIYILLGYWFMKFEATDSE